MKRLTLLLLALMLGGQVLAEEETVAAGEKQAVASEQKEESFFDSLRKKIELLTPKKKLTTAKAVGGVRGARADSDELYWKGEQNDQAIDAGELAAFDEAVTLAEAGDSAAAEQSLNKFIAEYPESRLREDAEKAVAMLKQPEPAVESGDMGETAPETE